MLNLMSSMFVRSTGYRIGSAKERSSYATRDAMIEGCGIQRNLELARFRHRKLLLQLTTEVILIMNRRLHRELCLSFLFLCLFCLFVSSLLIFPETNVITLTIICWTSTDKSSVFTFFILIHWLNSRIFHQKELVM